MAELSIGDAVGAGFCLIRRRPVAVLIWGLLRTAMLGAMVALMAPTLITLFAEVAKSAAAGQPPTPDVTTMMRMQSTMWLLNIVSLFVVGILYCAVFRGVIHTEQGRLAYLRLGQTELMQFGLMIGAYFAFGIGLVVLMIPAAIVVGVRVAVHAVPAAVSSVLCWRWARSGASPMSRCATQWSA